MTRYEKGKEKARVDAIKFQHEFYRTEFSWLTLADELARFERLAKRYGLKKEFRENGIL